MVLSILLQTTNVNTVSDIYNIGIMETILNWKDTNALDPSHAGALVQVGQLLCAFFAFIWCGVKLYPVIAGEDRLSVLPLLRPFVIAMVLMWWGEFVYVCNLPGAAVQAVGKELFDNSWTLLREKSVERYKLMDIFTNKTIEVGTYVSRAEHAERNSLMQSSDIGKDVSGDSSMLTRSLARVAGLIVGGLKQVVFSIINYVCLMFMNTVVAGVLLMQAAGLLIMAMIGPLAFAFSCLEPFKQSWAQWVARFISISLWSGFAYIVCYIGTQVMISALQVEINYYNALLANDDWNIAAQLAMFGSDVVMFNVICLFVAFGMIVIFPVSTWVVQTSGGAAVLSPVKSAIGVGTAVAGAAVGFAAAGGAGLVGGANAGRPVSSGNSS